MKINKENVRAWVKKRFGKELWELCDFSETHQEHQDRVDCEIDDIVDSFFIFIKNRNYRESKK